MHGGERGAHTELTGCVSGVTAGRHGRILALLADVVRDGRWVVQLERAWQQQTVQCQ